ncbi:MAG: hypothetical protein AAF389_01810 [Gemmatimonadota bacterium]
MLELVQRATSARQSVAFDQNFRTYQADARGYVYFFLDRPDDADRVLVKADQIALTAYWRSPGQTRQTIIGMRDEKRLPTQVRYHIDHLTLVLDDFGETIRYGDGDEVDAVPHPAALSGQRVYDYRLADSLSLTHSDGLSEVRVYEIQVRPKDMDQPGYIGTLFVDRDRAAIVRMNFSFTPASYVDETLDYIRVSLDNSLWMGEYWLPWRQETEIRREAPLLDFQAGSVIRQRFRVSDYDFNTPLSPSLFRGRPVQAVSRAQREAFDFERGLFDDLEDSGGLRSSPAMSEVEEQVREVVQDELLSGLGRVRLFGDGLSDFGRYNRAEGVFAGAGVTLRPTGETQLRVRGGYAFGRGGPMGGVALVRRTGSNTLALEGRYDELGDIGGAPGATSTENSISAASGSKDYLDPYLRRGGTATLRWGAERGWSVSGTVERHSSAMDIVSDGPDTDFRPVRSVVEGTLGKLELSGATSAPGGGGATFTTGVGRMGGSTFGTVDANAAWTIQHPGGNTDLTLSGGATTSGAPSQSLFLLGGRHTLLGQEYRRFAGRAYLLAQYELTIPLWAPYLGIRILAAGGSTWLDGVTPPSDWGAIDTDGLRGSVGLGLSLGWDTVHLDVGHGVRGGGWEAMFSIAPEFRGWL